MLSSQNITSLNGQHTEVVKTSCENELIMNLDRYKVSFNNRESVTQIIKEVYHTNEYSFESSTDSPMIIDAGSNIGISAMFFKSHYPNANIICFEADNNAFTMLEKNIHQNALKNVTAIHAALSSQEGEIEFYGQIDTDSPDARGNSILPEWGCQRASNQSIKVKAERLSTYLNQPVNCLKIDIEGAEQQVLEESFRQLHWVENIILEIHSAEGIQSVNDYDKIMDLLKKAGFHLVVKQKNLDDLSREDLLPKAICSWVKKLHPKLFLVKGTRR